MTSLSEMMAALQMMERLHDEMPEILPHDIQEHFEAIQNINDKVDALHMYMESCKRNAADCHERAEPWIRKAKRHETNLKNTENYVLYLLKRHPNLEYRGSDVKFKLRLNPPALSCSLATNKSFSNVIHPDAVHELPERFREARVVWQLKTSEVKKALESDQDLGFAKLERGEKLVTEFKTKGET